MPETIKAGIPCPSCHREMSHRVLNTRMVDGTLRRRRQCGCGCRFTTQETILYVIKERQRRTQNLPPLVRQQREPLRCDA